jgi:light-regulated signal transduction histidine kinase (bacteriophytochrome)
VTWEIEDGLEAYCDASLVHAVLENLLGNAWKFTSKTENARIEFRAVPNTLPMQYVIRDNGAGFDMKYMDKLFGPFQRLHSEREFPGTGIGLATVQRIVHKHGGEVRTESQVGQGATFSFTLEPDDVGAVDTRITRAAEGTRRSSSRRIRAAQPQATERTA